MKEESGLEVDPENIEKIGILDFSFVENPVIMNVHIFTASKFSGIPTESEGRVDETL